MTVDTAELDRLAEDDDYPHVVGAESDCEYALDHVYAAVDEEIEDEHLLESLAHLPAQYLRGSPTESDVRYIVNDIERLTEGNEKIAERVEEAKDLL